LIEHRILESRDRARFLDAVAAGVSDTRRPDGEDTNELRRGRDGPCLTSHGVSAQEPDVNHDNELRPRDKAIAVRRHVEMFHLIVRSGYPPTEAELRARAEGAARRSNRPDGFPRQLIAIQTAPSRVRKFRRVRAPALVLHGRDDPLAPMAGGEDTAANIPGARLRIVRGMGHFLPEALMPLLVDEIASHFLEAEDRAQSGALRAAGGSR
jgi:pimeloyl-ACP methyl ester carboxylesterase